MILGFKTQINGKENLFVEKIIKGLVQKELITIDSGRASGKLMASELNPKLHTIRDDSKNRWKAGTKIDFFINCRKADMTRFAPILPVVSIQDIMITRNKHGKAMVFIDGKIFYMQDWSVEQKYKMLHFAHNDGFDTTEEFFEYFDTDFNGKIIHWTNLKY